MLCTLVCIAGIAIWEMAKWAVKQACGRAKRLERICELDKLAAEDEVDRAFEAQQKPTREAWTAEIVAAFLVFGMRSLAHVLSRGCKMRQQLWERVL